MPPAAPTFAPAAIVPPHDDGVTLCNVVTCDRTRIHSKCSRKCCRKHCRALGGCEASSHDPDDILDDTLELRNPPPPLVEELPPPLPPPPPSAVPGSPPPPAVMLKGKGKSRAIPPPIAGPSKPRRIAGDAEDPRYAIHLKPIFTEAYAEEEANDLRQRRLEKEQREAAERAKHQVTLYVWTAVSAISTVILCHYLITPFNRMVLSLTSTSCSRDSNSRTSSSQQQFYGNLACLLTRVMRH